MKIPLGETLCWYRGEAICSYKTVASSLNKFCLQVFMIYFSVPWFKLCNVVFKPCADSGIAVVGSKLLG